MTIIRLVLNTFFVAFYTFSFAQEKNSITIKKLSSADSLVLANFEAKLQNGDKRAWRDLATYVDILPQSVSVLNRYCIFPKEVLDFDKPISKKVLLDFFYQNQSKIDFSQLFDAFYLKNLNNIKPIFDVKQKDQNTNAFNWRENINAIEQLLQQNNIDSVTALLKHPSLYNANDALLFLIQLANREAIGQFSQPQRISFYRALSEALSYSRKENGYNSILQLVENQKLPSALISWPLARITNIFAGHEVKDEQIVSRYRFYFDSLKTLEAMRLFGYDRYRPSLQRSFFDQDVDYFGALVATAFRNDSYWWIRENAINDMVSTKHPRLLFYFATQAFKERNRKIKFGHDSAFFIHYNESLTHEIIEVEGQNGKMLADPKDDLVALKNYLVYWSNHWEDYEWDEYHNLFVNKKQKLAKKEQYERLFRRLSSTNDSVAIQSYRELTIGDPSEITKLATKYRGLLRNINVNLPEFKYKFLEQIVQLVDFSRNENIRFQPTQQEEKKFTQIIDAQSPTLRYVTENQLIKSLTLEQITPFEYWGLLNQSQPNVSFSLSRILDYWYSNHWKEIVLNETQLRLFLKKTYLLAQINSSGTAMAYAKKLDLGDLEQKKRLEAILLKENDSDILELIKNLLKPTILEKSNTIEAKNDDKNDEIEKLLQRLNTQTNISINDINAVTLSSAYKPTYRTLCLKSLVKIATVEDIFQLKFAPKLSIQKGELAYIENLKFNIKDLDDFPRIVEVDNPTMLFNFIMDRAKNATIDEMGGLINNLFRATWFSNYLISGNFEANHALELKKTLERYLNESELISEFEEQATARNIAQLDNYNKPIEERLQNAFSTANDDDTKLKIMSEIISRISYNDIAKVLPFVLQMEAISGKSTITFLHEDFGIPIFEFENDKALQDFIERHKTLKEKELYLIYLQKYGVDFQKSNGELDFDKIYNILKFDLVTPYTGASGNRRDDYVYGIIKVLELQFDNRLGFHPKLNESQMFYSYNASKRAKAWMNYLTEKKLINPNLHSEVMSFNN
jgi:hypothetical protein